MRLPRASGVLLHPTSLPGTMRHGITASCTTRASSKRGSGTRSSSVSQPRSRKACRSISSGLPAKAEGLM